MVKFVFIISLFLATNFLVAQDSPDYMGKGLIQIQPTVSPGYMFGSKLSTVYFRVNTEWYISDNASLKTDAYIYFGTNADVEVLSANHSAFLGVFYHKLKGNADFYGGLQPGIALTKTKRPKTGIYEPVLIATPLISGTIGANYYLSKFIHFYAQMQYVYGKHMPKYYENISLSEVRFSIGVGLNYNFFVKKSK